MKIPNIIYNDKLLDRLSWFMEIGGITLFPWIILRERYRDGAFYKKIAPRLINHESIHIEQQKELLVIGFYLWYLIEWFIKLFIYGKKAYKNISFEREGYENRSDFEYLKTRKRYSFLKYIF
jgi:hypothetical protein